jgi:outer membrane lipopolysaccharide assembly protein LptE/RlpB
MKKKISILFLLLILSSCGYEAKYSSKNIERYNFSISDMNFIGDRVLNIKIREKLNIYTQSVKERIFILEITSKSEKITIAKDSAGDPTDFKNVIQVSVSVFMDDELIDDFSVSENFSYKNDSDKFELESYEREIKNNLAELAAEKLIIKISDIQ